MNNQTTTMIATTRDPLVDALRVRMSTSRIVRTPVWTPTGARCVTDGNSEFANVVVRLDVSVDVRADARCGQERGEGRLRYVEVLVDVAVDVLELERAVGPSDRSHTRRVH